LGFAGAGVVAGVVAGGLVVVGGEDAAGVVAVGLVADGVEDVVPPLPATAFGGGAGDGWSSQSAA
jgi:hypothetical protein